MRPLATLARPRLCMTTLSIIVRGGCLSLQLQGRERLHHREHEVPEVDACGRGGERKSVPQTRLLFLYSQRAIRGARTTERGERTRQRIPSPPVENRKPS